MCRTLNYVSKSGKTFIHKNKMKPSYYNDFGRTMSYYNEDGSIRLSDHWPLGEYKIEGLPQSSKSSDYLFLCIKSGNKWEFTGVKFKRILLYNKNYKQFGRSYTIL